MKEYKHIFDALVNGEKIQMRTRDCWGDSSHTEVLEGVIRGDDIVLFRVKPKTININGHEIPEPLRELPPTSTRVFIPPLFADNYTSNYFTFWNSSEHQLELLRRGLIHGSEEAAKLHAIALVSLTETGRR